MSYDQLPERLRKTSLALLLAMIFPWQSGLAANTAFLDERFVTLDDWQPMTFPNIKRHSTYSIQPCGNKTCLLMESDNSASGLLWEKTFNVYEYSLLKWRWKVSNVYRQGDSATKDGDDYPARLYVLFSYDPEKASASKRIKYEFARLVHGQFPPDSTISYIWDNRETTKPFIVNAYASEARMIPVSSGSTQVNTWQEYSVNILDDYKMAFGQDPPALASLAIMCDSDNTQESAKAMVDYIRIESAP